MDGPTVEALQAEILRKQILARQRQSQMTPMQKAMGIAKQGVQEGAAAIASIPNAMMQPNLTYEAGDTDLTKYGYSPEFDAKMRQRREESEKRIRAAGEDITSRFPTAPEALSSIEGVLGPGVQPEEGSGRVLKSAMSGGTAGALGGPVGVAGGMVSGAAQQTAAEAGLPPWAQMLAGVGVPVTSAMTVGILKNALTNTPQKMIKNALKNATPQQMEAAQAFMDEAAKQGIKITPDEAYTLVSGGANNQLLALRRYVETSTGGGPRMSAAMAQRPTENAAALQNLTGQMGPGAAAGREAQVPFKVQGLAAKAMDDVYKARSASTEPFYASVVNPQNDLSSAAFSRLQSDAVIGKAIKEIRSDPKWQREISGVTDNNTIVLDAVKKKLDVDIGQAADSGDRNTVRLLGAARNDLVKAMDAEFPDYAAARLRHEQVTKNLVDPEQQGVLGGLSKDPISANSEKLMQEQMDLLQPPNPKTTTPEAIKEAAKRLNARDPTALAIWQRMRLEAEFAKATRQMQAAGANEWSGAKFALAVAGNEKQAANLKALVETLPNGATTWKGFENYLKILRAQGYRPHPGSLTEFNRLFTADVEAGRIPIGLVRPVKEIQDWWLNIKRHKNTDALAKMFLDPRGAEAMAKMAGLEPNSRLARFYVGVLSAEMSRIIDESEQERANEK